MLVDTDWAPRRNEVIPFEANLGPVALTGHGRVAYIERYQSSNGTTRYRLGVEFTLLSDASRTKLGKYIANLMAEGQETA